MSEIEKVLRAVQILRSPQMIPNEKSLKVYSSLIYREVRNI